MWTQKSFTQKVKVHPIVEKIAGVNGPLCIKPSFPFEEATAHSFSLSLSVKKISFALKENKSRSDLNDKWVFNRLNCFNLQNAANMKQNPYMIYVFNKKAFQKDAYRLLADHILAYPRPQAPCPGGYPSPIPWGPMSGGTHWTYPPPRHTQPLPKTYTPPTYPLPTCVQNNWQTPVKTLLSPNFVGGREKFTITVVTMNGP